MPVDPYALNHHPLTQGEDLSYGKSEDCETFSFATVSNDLTEINGDIKWPMDIKQHILSHSIRRDKEPVTSGSVFLNNMVDVWAK